MLNLNWNTKERKAVGISISIISLFGMWSLEKDDASLKIRWFISIISVASIVIQSTYEWYLNCVSLDKNAENLYPINYGIISLSKLLFFFIHRRKLRFNVNAMVEDWSSEDAKSFGSIMETSRNNCKKLTLYFLGFGCTTIVTYNLRVFLLDPDSTITLQPSDGGNVTTILKKRFLFPAACSFSAASQTWYWSVICIHAFTFTIAFGTNYCPDLFFTSVTSHLSAQFKILRIKFANFQKCDSLTETREKFNSLVTKHNYLLDLADNLEATFTMIVFVQMVTNVFILNVAGFNVLVLLRKRQWFNTVPNASIILISLVQTFMYSFTGERLTSQGEDIAQSVYNCQWYSLPEGFPKSVMIVMARARFPIGITAGKFFKMTRSTFTDIVKTAASYLSVLRLMIKDDV